MQVEVAQISAWARTDLVDRVKDQKKQINIALTPEKCLETCLLGAFLTKKFPQ